MSPHLAQVLSEVATRIRVESPQSANDDDYYGERIFRTLQDNGYAIIRPLTPWTDS